jgi:hypothetical protein
MERLNPNRFCARNLLERHITCNNQMEKRRLVSNSKYKLTGAVLLVLR